MLEQAKLDHDEQRRTRRNHSAAPSSSSRSLRTSSLSMDLQSDSNLKAVVSAAPQPLKGYLESTVAAPVESELSTSSQVALEAGFPGAQDIGAGRSSLKVRRSLRLENVPSNLVTISSVYNISFILCRSSLHVRLGPVSPNTILLLKNTILLLECF